MTRCWCGNAKLVDFSPDYLRCPECETLVLGQMPARQIATVSDDASDFYGREYWYAYQQQSLGFPNIEQRARLDLSERCLFWLRTLLKYKRPPGKVLELGAAHGGFVALLRWAGFDAIGLELSPSIAQIARESFDVPMLVGNVESQEIAPNSLDAIVLIDVMEHLPEPCKTLEHCLHMLKPDGVLVIHMPRYVEGCSYETMLSKSDRFLAMLQPDEHIHLFSATAARMLFARLDAPFVKYEPSFFGAGNQFLFVGKTDLQECPVSEPLLGSPQQRLIQSLLDLDVRLRAEIDGSKLMRLARFLRDLARGTRSKIFPSRRREEISVGSGKAARPNT